MLFRSNLHPSPFNFQLTIEHRQAGLVCILSKHAAKSTRIQPDRASMRSRWADNSVQIICVIRFAPPAWQCSLRVRLRYKVESDPDCNEICLLPSKGKHSGTVFLLQRSLHKRTVPVCAQLEEIGAQENRPCVRSIEGDRRTREPSLCALNWRR